MTIQIALVLLILLVAVVVFIGEWLRADLVALLVLSTLAITGLVTPDQAVSGFSSPAVITVWAIFILSGALSRTGVASIFGQQILRLGRLGERSLMVLLMLSAGGLSAFMNNIGVVALLLPVVLTVSRRTGISRGKLLMPISIGSFLGGMITLIATPTNLLAANALFAAGLTPFRFFDFAPTGLAALLAGILFMVLIGHRLLPSRDISREFKNARGLDLDQVFDLQEQLGVLHVPADSALAGKTLIESRIGSALGLNVIGVIRNGETQLAPPPSMQIQVDDRLVVTGEMAQVSELHGKQFLIAENETLKLENLVSMDINLAEVKLTSYFAHLGRTIQESNFRQRYGVIVLAIWRDEVTIRTNLDNLPLHEQDVLLLQGSKSTLEQLAQNPEFELVPGDHSRVYQLQDRLILVSIPEESSLVGKSLGESRIAQGFGLTVLGIVRDGTTRLMIPPNERFQAGDRLLLKGRTENLDALRGLQNLQIEDDLHLDQNIFESEQVGLVEAVLSPHTTLVGKTLRQLHFREKFGLSVLAIWREGEPLHASLGELKLRFGDALLLHGTREKLKVLASDADFLILADDIQEPLRWGKAPLAALIMLGVVLSAIFGVLPIHIAAVVGSALVVLSGCLTMEEAYRFIDWKAVFLIAAMIPLGIAMDTSGAAELVGSRIIGRVEVYGPIVLISTLFLLTVLASQFMPSPVILVLMAPIALQTASDLSLSPFALMMTIAVAASSGFMSPVAHPANVLIMGPGGYRFKDFLRVGTPLTIVVLIITLIVLPIFWPLQ